MPRRASAPDHGGTENLDSAGSMDYRNSKGEPWSSRIDDVVDHVLFHSTYHRGQIAAERRKAGNRVPDTDYIHATRQKLIG